MGWRRGPHGACVVLLWGLLCFEQMAAAGTFGQAGELVPSGNLSIEWTWNQAAPVNGEVQPETANHRLIVFPKIMFFAWENVGVGLGGEYSATYEQRGNAAKTSRVVSSGWGGVVFVGYNLKITSALSLFPTVHGMYRNRWSTEGWGDSAIQRKTHELVVSGFLPFLVHFGNFYIGVGPEYEQSVWRKTETAVGSAGFGAEFDDYLNAGLRVRTELGGHF